MVLDLEDTARLLGALSRIVSIRLHFNKRSHTMDECLQNEQADRNCDKPTDFSMYNTWAVIERDEPDSDISSTTRFCSTGCVPCTIQPFEERPRSTPITDAELVQC